MSEETVENKGDILPGCPTFDDFIQAAYPMMMKSIRVSNSIPKSQQFGYYKTYSEFEKVMNVQSYQLQDTMDMVLRHVGIKRKIHSEPDGEKFELIVDANDKLLDRAHKTMSLVDGTRFNPDEDFGEKTAPRPKTTAKVPVATTRNDVVKLTVQQKIIRPQVMFKDKIDNSNKPWEPIIKDKPNALKPLSILSTVNEDGQETYTHPYEFELDKLKPKDDRLVRFEQIESAKSIDETPLVYVETEKDLDDLMKDLKTQKVIAVDLEHHSFRSFMGFTCLMQISTRNTDYIIDTLSLRHKLHVLNEIFTDPKVLKIFHGAQSDIEWLQRDFGVYVVHMFDTFEAAKVLDYPKLGLAYLLKRFCQVDANKQFQLYDWRTRPLPDKARFYARQDTHYLIYIYEMMSNELFDKSAGPRSLEVVFNNSRDVCKRVYMKPLLDENSHMTLYRRMQRPFDTRQLFALKEIYKWRDGIARTEDESPGYVLSNHMMMQIAQTLPREVQGILACCNPIPPLVRQHALTIHSIILKAKEVPLVKEDDMEVDNQVAVIEASEGRYDVSHNEVSAILESDSNAIAESNGNSDDDATAESDGNEIADSENDSDCDALADSDRNSDSDATDSDSTFDSDAISDSEKSLDSDGENSDHDVVVEAILKRQKTERAKPPDIKFGDLITDFSFSPAGDLIILASNDGDLNLYSYDLENIHETGKIEAHSSEEECKVVEFSECGSRVFSASTNIVISDIETLQMLSFINNAHNDSILSLVQIDSNKLISGDDEGILKIFDLRQRHSIFKNKNKDIEDTITSILYKDNKISCTSGNGLFTIYDIRKNEILYQSDFYKSDLTCSANVDNHILCGTLTGEILLYKWSGVEMGKYDPVPKLSLNSILTVSENIVVSGWDDHKIRAFYINPNQEIGIIGQDSFPISKLDLSHDGTLIASSAMGDDLKFWNIEYLEGYEAKKKKKKKKKTTVNLPSSNVEDRGSFFSELS